MTDQPRKRITIDAPDGSTILAARHLDATEGRVQIGSTVDTSTRSAITRVLGYIAKAHGSASLPASTAPLAAGLPLVQGRCPACGRASLFLGDGGYVTCSIIDCPNPSAATELLCGDAAAPLARAEAALSDMTRDRNKQQWYAGENDRKRKVQRERADQAEATLREVLDAFEAYWARASYDGPGETAVQPEHLQAWRAVLDGKETP